MKMRIMRFIKIIVHLLDDKIKGESILAENITQNKAIGCYSVMVSFLL